MGQNQSSKPVFGHYVGPEIQGQTRILRDIRLKEDQPLHTYFYSGCDTLLKVFKKAVSLTPKAKFLGTRENLGDNKFGKYKWKSYAEIDEVSDYFIRGLHEQKLTHEISYLGFKTKFIGFYSKARLELPLADIGFWKDSIANVTLYDTLGASNLLNIIGEAELEAIIVEKDTIEKAFKLKTLETPTLKALICLDPYSENEVEMAKGLGLQLFLFQDIIENGKKSKENIEFAVPSENTICSLCYTSGTTGASKGVILTHRNLVVPSGIMVENYAHLAEFEGESYLCYLPYAHVFGKLELGLAMHYSACLGYYHGEILKLPEDAKVLKPTVFGSVPRLYNRIAQQVKTKFDQLTGFKAKLVQKALSTKLKNLTTGKGYTHPLYDRLIFRKVKAQLGGRIRLFVSASAPISEDVLNMIKICFGCPVLEAYGQTETAGPAVVSNERDFSANQVGAPLMCSELKLIDVPELNYFTTQENPKGEILIRGPGCFHGYFKKPELSKETLDPEGWVHTGDVGEILPSKTLRIIDRVKNFFKLSQVIENNPNTYNIKGEYISPEKLENVYKESKFVFQIMVYGESWADFVIAIISPLEEKVMEWASQNEIQSNFEELCQNPKLNEYILNEFNDLAKKYKLNKLEMIRKLALTPKQFSIENGTLTPIQKLKRKEAKEFHQDLINFLMKNN